MTATEIYQVSTGLSGPLFVIASMLAMTIYLTTTQFRQSRVAACRVVNRP